MAIFLGGFALSIALGVIGFCIGILDQRLRKLEKESQS